MHNGKGYIMVTTDMCMRKSHKWDNYDLLKSYGLYHMLIKKEGGKSGKNYWNGIKNKKNRKISGFIVKCIAG